MTTIYICGGDTVPVSEEDSSDLVKITTRLKSMKCKVLNPTESVLSQMRWSDNLNNRIELIKDSQAVYVLPNWRDDIMSRIELTVAMDMKLHTLFHPVSTKDLKQLITTLDS